MNKSFLDEFFLQVELKQEDSVLNCLFEFLKTKDFKLKYPKNKYEVSDEDLTNIFLPSEDINLDCNSSINQNIIFFSELLLLVFMNCDKFEVIQERIDISCKEKSHKLYEYILEKHLLNDEDDYKSNNRSFCKSTKYRNQPIKYELDELQIEKEEKLYKEISLLEAKIINLTNEIEILENENIELKQKNLDTQRELELQQITFKSKDFENDKVAEENSDLYVLKQKLEINEEELNKVNITLKLKEKKFEEIEASLKEKIENLTEKNFQMSSCIRENERLRNKLTELKGLKERISQYESMEKQLTQYSKVIETLNKEKYDLKLALERSEERNKHLLEKNCIFEVGLSEEKQKSQIKEKSPLLKIDIKDIGNKQIIPSLNSREFSLDNVKVQTVSTHNQKFTFNNYNTNSTLTPISPIPEKCFNLNEIQINDKEKEIKEENIYLKEKLYEKEKELNELLQKIKNKNSPIKTFDKLNSLVNTTRVSEENINNYTFKEKNSGEKKLETEEEKDLISSVLFGVTTKLIELEYKYKKLLCSNEETCLLLNKAREINFQLNKEKSIFQGIFSTTNIDKIKLSWFEKEKSIYDNNY